MSSVCMCVQVGMLYVCLAQCLIIFFIAVLMSMKIIPGEKKVSLGLNNVPGSAKYYV